MNIRPTLGVIGLALMAVLLGAPADAKAQCGDDCDACGWSSYEGNGAGDKWAGGCMYQSSGHCDFCLAPQLVSDTGPTEAEIVEALRAASGRQLQEIADLYGEFLRVHAPRNLVVVTGVGCDPGALGTVLFVTAEAVRHLQASGVPTLSDVQAVAN